MNASLIAEIVGGGAVMALLGWLLYRPKHAAEARRVRIDNEILILEKVNRDNDFLREEVNRLRNENTELRAQIHNLTLLYADICRMLPPGAAPAFDHKGGGPGATAPNDPNPSGRLAD